MNKVSLANRLRKSMRGNYRGVMPHQATGRWRVCIVIDGKPKHFGYFDEELDGLKKANEVYAEYFPDYPELQQTSKEQEQININKIICNKW